MAEKLEFDLLTGKNSLNKELDTALKKSRDVENSLKSYSSAFLAGGQPAKEVRKFWFELDRAKESTRGLGDITKTAFGVFAGGALLGGVSGFFSALRGGIDSSISAANRQEDAINALNSALKRSGDFSEEASSDFQNFASQLQRVSTFGDEVILEQLAFAKSLGLSSQQTKDVTRAAIELSSALGVSLESAVRNIAKTYSGLKGELGELLPSLRNVTSEQLKAGEATSIILNQFGGAAASKIETTRGSFDQLSNTFGDLLEVFGQTITQSSLVQSAISGLNQAIQGIIEPTTTTELDRLNASLERQQKLLSIESGRGASEEYKERLRDQLAATRQQITAILKDQEIAAERAATAERLAAEQTLAVQEEKAASVLNNEKILRDQLALESQNFRTQQANLEIEDELARNEAEILRIRDFELRKNELAAELAEQKALLIEEEQAREAELRRVAFEEELNETRIRNNALLALDKTKRDTDKKNQEKAAKEAIELERGKSLALNGIASNFIQAGLSISKQGSSEFKALAIADATRQTFVAANNALSTKAPWPLPAAFAASAVALGLANVSRIANSGFQDGGFIGGATGASIGGDTTTVNAREGELILNADQQANLLSMINNGGMGGQDIVINIDGREIVRVLRDQRAAGARI